MIDRIHEVIKAARLSRGLEVEETAKSVGITEASYYDLESYADEFKMALAMDKILELIDVLEIETDALLESDECGEEITKIHNFVNRLEGAIKKESRAVIEEKIGYQLPDTLSPLSNALKKWNYDCLRSMSEVLGLKFGSVIDACRNDRGCE